ncbi:MAG: HAD family hydrolase [Halobacteriales archaeon]
MPPDHAARVYDLDGTLVRLAVDWDAAAADVVSVFREAGIDADGADLWDLLDRAPEHGLDGAVEAAISSHERDGAERSRRLAAADDLAELDVPVAVCSLNCEAACRIALEKHGLAEDVDAVIGRDSVGAHKPDPEPLLAAARALSVPPEETLFVGDSERDARTAERAGTRFEYVGDGPTDY